MNRGPRLVAPTIRLALSRQAPAGPGRIRLQLGYIVKPRKDNKNHREKRFLHVHCCCLCHPDPRHYQDHLDPRRYLSVHDHCQHHDHPDPLVVTLIQLFCSLCVSSTSRSCTCASRSCTCRSSWQTRTRFLESTGMGPALFLQILMCCTCGGLLQ